MTEMSNARVRRWWYVAAPMILMGALTFGAFILGQMGVKSLLAGYLVVAAAGLATGAILAAHTTMRATREIPIVVAVVIGAMIAGVCLVPRDIFADGIDDLTDILHTVLMVITAIAGSVAGGLAVRRTQLREPGRGMLAIISLFVMIGLVIVSMLAVAIAGHAFNSNGGLALALVFAASIVGSFVGQMLVSERRVWSASAGICLAILSNHDILQKPAALLIGMPICVAIASIGARIAWAAFGQRAALEESPPLPPAQLR